MRRILAALAMGLTLVAAFGAEAQDLARRAWHGVVVRPAEGGLAIDQVQPGSTAERAGLSPGDLITAVNGTAVSQPGDLGTGALRLVAAGETVAYAIQRDGQALTLSAYALPRPEETPGEGLVQTYGAVAFQGGLLRTLVTRRADLSGPAPAVLFIQGYPCASYIDLNPAHPYRRIVDQLARAGYVVMRVDKPGVGDSRGGPVCEDMDMVTEGEAFGAAFDALRATAGVDPDAVFVFGHSLGGISAPLLAQSRPVAGVAVAGITPTPWFEYYLLMSRTQGANTTPDLLAHEADMRRLYPFIYGVMIARQTPAEAIGEDEALARIAREQYGWDGGRRMFGRDASLFWDLQSLNQPQLWADYGGPVLAMHGGADMEVMLRDGPRTIARIVNLDRPGQGLYCEVPGVNHSFAQTGSMDAEYAARARPDYGATVLASYDPRMIEQTLAWMAAVRAGSPTQAVIGAVEGVDCQQPG